MNGQGGILTDWAEAKLVKKVKMTETYISGMTWESETDTWAAAQRDKSVGGNQIKVAGAAYNKGIGIHADSTITLKLNGEYDYFRSVIGVDDEADGNIASVIFKLTADGTEIYNSGTMLKGISKTIDISVKGVNELKLTVTGNSTTGGWPYDWGHADWAEAKLVKRYNAAETADITGFHNAVKRSVIKPGTTSAVEAVEIKPIEHSNVSTGTLKLKANQDYILEFEYWADVEGDIIITDLYPDSLPEAFLTSKKSVQKARLTINSGLPEMAYASLRFFVNNGYGRVNSGSVYIANVRLYAKEVDTNPFRYAGEYLDFETGYIYLRRRYYDPGIGRFINEDPIRSGSNYYVGD